MERDHANDSEEELSFITLAAVTANVVSYLSSKKNNEEQTRQPDADKTRDERDSQELADIHRRLREIASMERRLGRKD